MRTKIEWCDYTINPVKGKCPVACSYCYARRMYDRFKWNPEIRFEGVINLSVELLRINKPSRIFVGSTIELFGGWIDPHWMQLIFEAVRLYSQHTFIFLTKRPENLVKWSPFSPNCWVGTSIPRYWDDSVIGHPEAFNRIRALGEVKATVKFVSFEPLQEAIASNFDFGLDMAFKAYGINWVIIGQQTPVSKKTEPKIEWVRAIVQAADKAGISVFLKNNLQATLTQDKICGCGDYHILDWARSKDGLKHLRQEFPVEAVK